MAAVAPQMFTPLQGAGNYFGIEPGDLGDGTYCVAQNLEGLPIACALPDNPAAQSMVINAKTALKFYFNREAAADGLLPMEVAAGSIVCITNRDRIKNLCFIIEATTSFTLEYGEGEGGVPPFFFLTDAGGVTPPPPPGGAAVITTNVVHVMKPDGAFGGNDATGTRNRLDLPFLTITAAQGVALPGDTIAIWPGDYDEGDLGIDGVIYDRIGANIITPAGYTSIFTANGISFEVRGWGQLAYADSAGYGLLAQAGGSMIVDGDITSEDVGVRARQDSRITVNGKVSAVGIGTQCEQGVVRITGDSRSENNYGAWTNDSTSDLRIGGNAISATNYGAVADQGNMVVAGNAILEATGSGNASYAGAGAVLHILGDAINQGVGAACSTTMAGAELYVHGEARNVSGACCRATDGYVKVFGNAYSTTERAVLAQGGTVEIMGTAIADTDVAVNVDAGGTCILWGGARTNLAGSAAVNITGPTDTLILRGAAYVFNDGTGNAIDNPLATGGVVTSYGAYGAAPVAGTLTLNGTYTVL